MKQILFKRILPAFLVLIMVVGMLSPMSGVKAAAPTETTVSGVDYAPWSGGKWQLVVTLTTPMEGVSAGDWSNLTGLTYSVNGGESQALACQISGAANVVTFITDAAVLPQDAPVGTTVTVNPGTALSGDESKGLKFAAPVTLARKSDDTTGAGWVLQKAGPTETKVSGVGVNAWSSSKWNIYLNLETALSGVSGEDWAGLVGLTYSVNGGAAKTLSLCVGGAANAVCLMPDALDVPENVAEGTELTIHAGQAVAADGSKGIKFKEEITLVKTATEWEVKTNIPTETTVSGVDYAPWSGGKWQFAVALTTPLEGVSAGDWSDLTGLTYSVNGGESKALACQIGGAANMVTFITDAAVLPQDAPVGTTVTINAGEALSADESKGIKFTAPITLARKSTDTTGAGWVLQKAGPTETKISGVGVNAWSVDKWNIYLNLETALSGVSGEDWAGLVGLTYSVNGGAAQDLSLCVGGTANAVCLMPNAAALPQNAPVGTTLTIHAGQAVAVDGSKGIKLAQAITLVKNSNTTEDCWEIQTSVATKTTVSGIDWSAWNSTKWNLVLTLSTPLTGGADWAVFTGITCSVDGGEAKALPLQVDGDAGVITIMPEAVVLAQNVPIGTTITINPGVALTGDNTRGIEITEAITFVRTSNDTAGCWAVKDSSADNAVETTVSEVDVNVWNSTKWNIYLKLTTPIEDRGLDDWEGLTGLTYSINDGEAKALPLCVGGMSDLICLMPSASDVPEAVAVGTKMTIHAGKAMTSDGSRGLRFATAVTLVKSAAGWVLEGTSLEPDVVTTVTVNKVVDFIGEDPYTQWRAGMDCWDIYLSIDNALSSFTPWGSLMGMTYSVNGGVEKPLTIQPGEAGMKQIFLRISDTDVPENIVGKKLTIKGIAAKNDNSEGIQFSKTLVLVGTEDGWFVEGTQVQAVYKKASAKSVNAATSYQAKLDPPAWHVYLDINGDISEVPREIPLVGFQYSINGGEKKNLTNCNIQLHDGGTFFIAFTEDQLPGKITKDTTIRISGKAKTTSGIGIELTEDIVLCANQYGIGLGKFKDAPVYTDINVTKVNYATSFNDNRQTWDIYLETDKPLPGEKDSYFEGLVVEVNGKEYPVTAQHAMHEDTLYIPVLAEWLSKDAANGSKVTLKAGKGLQQVAGIGINLKKDVTVYKFFETVTLEKPVTNTTYTDITFSGLAGAIGFIEDADIWAMELVPLQKLPGEHGSNYYYLDVVLNGKSMKMKVSQEGKNIMLTIPENVLPRTAKTATLTVKAGSKAVTGHGEAGIRIKEDLTVYLFNGVWSDEKFDKVKEVDLACTRLFNFAETENRVDLYYRVNGEFPGKAWYNRFTMPAYVDGRKVEVDMYKADSAAGKILYIGVPKKDAAINDGTKITIKAGTVAEHGGYKITITEDFTVIRTNGIWVEYRETDAKAPEAQNLWNVARFEKGYIPVSIDGKVMMSGEQEYNKIVSPERMKDFTVSFSGKKLYNDAESSAFSLVLRGTPISEDDPISISVLNGYVITFEGYEITKETNPDEPEKWGTRPGYIYIWKNGVNRALQDQYCIGTYHNENDNPFYKYNEEYNYEVSVYNISETVACIELRINGKLVYKCYDEAGSDPADPAINEGVFGIYGVAPTVYGGETVELDTVIADKEECYVGDEVVVAATYPAVTTGVELAVDKDGGMIENGKFYATKAGTYKVSAKYNGKTLKPVSITVKERAVETDEETTGLQGKIVPLAIVTGVVILSAGAITTVIVKNRKKKS